MAKQVFVTGVAGYIGGSVAARLVKAGYKVKGLTRLEANKDKLKAIGIEAVIGDLGDIALVTKHAQEADIVIDAADSDNEEAVKTFLEALKGSGKIFIHTSGSSIVSDQANGEPSENIFDDHLYEPGSTFKPDTQKQPRVDIDKLVLDAAKDGITSMVICPCLIYGKGSGIKPESQQIPNLANEARQSGVAKCIGRGENIWSTVHIDDLTELYLKAIEKGQAGLFLFAENGEITFKEIAQTIKKALNLKTDILEWPVQEAIDSLGFGTAVFGLGSNSRIRGVQSRELGWQPSRKNVLEDAQRTCNALTAAAK
ncbi:NAD-dependent epimerase/dehydratase family protein [bacterium]|jgi:nucleoside-diphosphate-sugar epimerase|nr:NAD-dependent epimerase/dehydratase family protein [bacterium]MBP9807193.1 NAD-dependent epimerase/dehydratase family protein [bacterium]